MTIRTFATERELDNEILYVMLQHQSRENPIGRWQLVRRIFGEEAVPSAGEETDGNVYDRQVRDSIERLRPNHLVCNMGDGRGYFIARTREEYEEWKKYYLGSSYLKLQIVSRTDDTADQRFGKQPRQPDPLPLFEEVLT